MPILKCFVGAEKKSLNEPKGQHHYDHHVETFFREGYYVAKIMLPLSKLEKGQNLTRTDSSCFMVGALIY